jgi:hypothetical protein
VELLTTVTLRVITRWLPFRLLLFFLAAAATEPARAQNVPDEYEVRAAIVSDLSKFVTWPAARVQRQQSAFVIGLLGTDQQTQALERFMVRRSIDGKPVVVRRLDSAEHGDDCALVYIASSERKRYQDDSEQLARQGILTVGDGDRFVLSGGMVGLPVVGDRVEIQVNLTQVQRGGLSVSSKLLRLATVVH